ncbi:hypothetical protein DS901_06855 [Loktanella sp. D2R18]|uniref:hypothetical protein n=1 Tax=Rhodobacterales TaxID=204455 RepID=UPI000DEACA07|nr:MULTISPECIES: hypothetical protein [Rhodobacterales]MDO6589489.1 hypothetical protein [Yoonia sp. 1_MG-2023]RBW44136.1 hypothetical protein DS901_06855 [Loktanella sp. D2R18]
MQDTPPSDESEDVDGAAAQLGAQLPLWFSELAPGGDGIGFIEKSNRHSLMFLRRLRPILLVTFDNLSNVADKSPERVPWAYKFALDHHVSHLGVLAHGKQWYRDPQLINRMQQLADSGFFDGYERVVFAGTSMGGFAALVFASLVPGAHVLAFNPQSTLDPELVPWEDRYWIGRRQDWTLPLSDARGILDKCGPVSVFYDPYFAPDHKHFERIAGANVTPYKCWYSNHKSAVFLRKIDALKPLMHAGLFGEITEPMFYQLYRGRRQLPWYAGALQNYFTESGREQMGLRVRKSFRQYRRALKSAAGNQK